MDGRNFLIFLYFVLERPSGAAMNGIYFLCCFTGRIGFKTEIRCRGGLTTFWPSAPDLILG